MNTNRREALTLIAGGAAATLSGSATQAAKIKSNSSLSKEDVRAWVQAEARPFGPDPSAQDLASLAHQLADASVVGIGEATHGTHEDQAFKSSLVRSLIATGKVRVLALECNHRPGLRLDRYVSTGEGDPLDVIRADDFFQNWKTEELIGCISWIRAWNAAGREPVRIIGVDCQAVGADTLRALSWLRSTDQPAAAALEKDLAPLIANDQLREGRTFELIQSLIKVDFNAAVAATEKLAKLTRTRAHSGSTSAMIAAHAAKAAHQGLLMSIPITRFASAAEQSNPALYARRDEYMADNLLTLSAGARAAYWAHNMHVLPYDFDQANAPTTAGGYLKRRMGNRYRSVIFDFDGGRVHAKLQSQNAPPPGRAEPWRVFERPSFAQTGATLLAAAGVDRFWTVLGSSLAPREFLKKPFKRDWPGFVLTERNELSEHDAVPLEGADILVFFKEMTPSRLLPFVSRVE
jgi:erythromycin esterase